MEGRRKKEKKKESVKVRFSSLLNETENWLKRKKNHPDFM